jgi:hypothetical protein
MSTQPEITIRHSTEADAAALARLAGLDSAPPPAGPHLLLEEGGVLRAALPLDGGRALADPFHTTGELVVMLELRAARAHAADAASVPGGLAVRSAAWLRRALGARPAAGLQHSAAGRGA